MSTSRSLRDGCAGAVITGIFGIGSVALTIDWKLAVEQGRHPYFWMSILSIATVSAFIVGLFEWIRMSQTANNSTYSRLKSTITSYFGS
jgi:hypothetical protein